MSSHLLLTNVTPMKLNCICKSETQEAKHLLRIIWMYYKPLQKSIRRIMKVIKMFDIKNS